MSFLKDTQEIIFAKIISGAYHKLFNKLKKITSLYII